MEQDISSGDEVVGCVDQAEHLSSNGLRQETGTDQAEHWTDGNICEECCVKLTDLNIPDCEQCREKEQICIVGSDVVGLFPSLQERNTGKVVAEEVRESDKVLEGLNYQQIALYVRINKSLTGDLFSLRRILPWRRKVGGTLRTRKQ